MNTRQRCTWILYTGKSFLSLKASLPAFPDTEIQDQIKKTHKKLTKKQTKQKQKQKKNHKPKNPQKYTTNPQINPNQTERRQYLGQTLYKE